MDPHLSFVLDLDLATLQEIEGFSVMQRTAQRTSLAQIQSMDRALWLLMLQTLRITD